jgi:putative transposase
MIRERQHRLPVVLYQGYVTVAFTCCIKNKTVVFTAREIFDMFSDILFKEASCHYCDIISYIFMPDHCHLLLQGKSEKADTLKAIYMFKQKTGFWFSQHIKNICWQKDFYDHILRTDEEINKHVKYMLDNPVRKKIVEDWKVYPWKGSSICDINNWES